MSALPKTRLAAALELGDAHEKSSRKTDPKWYNGRRPTRAESEPKSGTLIKPIAAAMSLPMDDAPALGYLAVLSRARKSGGNWTVAQFPPIDLREPLEF